MHYQSSQSKNIHNNITPNINIKQIPMPNNNTNTNINVNTNHITNNNNGNGNVNGNNIKYKIPKNLCQQCYQISGRYILDCYCIIC